jgi:hypothetical protein
VATNSRVRKFGRPVEPAIPKLAGKLAVLPGTRRRYSLIELLVQAKRSRRRVQPDREWVSGKQAGRELI